MKGILKCVKDCTVCAEHLPLGPRPVVTASFKSKIIIIGQAPGRAVHESGIPWDDKSGENLRTWMQVDKETFYNTDNFAIIPMGFCYPGKAKTGDKPPRKECAPLWHEQLIEKIEGKPLILLIGKHAQDYYLPKNKKTNLTRKVMDFHEFLPDYFVLPHPSPLNNIWRAKNKWFEKDVVPFFKDYVHDLLGL